MRLRKFSGKDWVETDIRMFESVFELLREFVEEQKSWLEVLSHEYSWWTKFQLRYIPNRFRAQLSRELGLKHLDWEIALGEESPQQSAAAVKIKQLYLWYMDEYEKTDPWDKVPEPPGPLFNFGPVDETGCREMLFPEGPEWEEYNRMSRWASDETNRLYDVATENAVEVLRLRANLWT